MSGWIPLFRELKNHWLWDFKNPDKALAWVDMLMMANYEDNQFMIKGKIINCKRGQLAVSQVTLQKQWNMSQNKLKRFLVLLKNERMIDFETNELTTIITICNYSQYQDVIRSSERPNERAVERSTNEQSNDNITNKQINKKTNNTGKAKYVFTEPSLEEVIEYFQQRGTHIDPEKFHAYYKARDWKSGKNKIKDWKACLVTWEKNNNSSPAVAQSQPKQKIYLE